jgi:zinc/manganese transport system substrate-binding protein
MRFVHRFPQAILTVFLALALLSPGRVVAAEPMPVVATFSILGDMVQTIGGARVQVTTLVGPNGDPHVFRPTPRHAQAMAGAALVFANGLGFEGWMERLVEASGFRGRMILVSQGIETLEAEGHHDHQHQHKASNDHGAPDPHAWHDLGNGKIYARNIAAALIAADPPGKGFYEQRRDAFVLEIAALEQELAASLATLPPGPHRVVTSHDAFGYFDHAYGIEFLAPQGVSTEAEASAKDLAGLIRQIRGQKVAAVFLENIADPRLIEQIQRETGARIGGTLYSGSLSEPDGPAATYLAMMRHNISALLAALGGK